MKRSIIALVLVMFGGMALAADMPAAANNAAPAATQAKEKKAEHKATKEKKEEHKAKKEETKAAQ